MANIDPFTPIHNDVLEAIMAENLLASELRIILAIWRKTYGFKDGEVERRKFAYLGVKQIMNMTKLSERSVQRAIKAMVDKKIIIRNGAKTGFCKLFMAKSVTDVTRVDVTRVDVGTGVTDVGKSVTDVTNKRNNKQTIKKTTIVDDVIKDQSLIKNPATSHSKFYPDKPIVNPILPKEGHRGYGGLKGSFPKEDYAQVIGHVTRIQGLKLLGNYTKQQHFAKSLFLSGYTVDDLKKAASNMVADPYWSKHPFDLVNVYNNIHKYQQREVPLTKEQELILQYDTPEERAKTEEAKKKMRSIGL